jgi:DNA-binding MarR family transcriptional regulator
LTHLIRRHAATLPLTLAQSSVLGILFDGKPHRISELADIEQVETPTMTQIVARMEAQHWVERTVCKEDRRGVAVRITMAGRRLAEKVTASRTDMLEDRLSRLSGEERRAIEAALPALDHLLGR